MPGDARVIIDHASLDALFSSADGPVGRELARRAIKVEAAAKRICPVDTGRLRASITHRLEHDAEGLLAIIGTDVEYAAYVEFGTSHMRAQPYLRPALAEATR